MAKLPADLPENWTSGQIISPNGTEVGLDAKHGYNYLMKQVNAAQSGVNTLSDNMTGVAQESTLQGVKTDVETLSTAAAKEATLQTVKTNVAQVQTDVTDLSQNFNDLTSIWQHTDTTVDTVLSRVGTTTDTNGSQTTGTVMGKLNKVMEGTEGQLTQLELLAANKGSATATFSTSDLLAETTPKTVLNITGKGLLFEIKFLYNAGWWKLVVDGLEILNAQIYTRNSSVYAGYSFGTSTGPSVRGFSGYQDGAIVQNNGGPGTTQAGLRLFPGYIPQFTQSLQLIFLGAGAAGTEAQGSAQIQYGVVTN